MKPVLEVAVDGPFGAATRDLGIPRLELCADLHLDGLTPSEDLVRSVRREFPGTMSVMVRVKPGPFTASPADLDVMLRSMQRLRELGVDAFVLGVLRSDGGLDRDATLRCVDAAASLPVTFHRAFDRVREPLAVAQELVHMGIRSLLTSGGAATAMEGIETLRELCAAATVGSAPAIIAAGRIRAQEATQLACLTGLSVIHRSGFKEGHWDEEGLRATLRALHP
jgi:copper homeostasis protein